MSSDHVTSGEPVAASVIRPGMTYTMAVKPYCRKRGAATVDRLFHASSKHRGRCCYSRVPVQTMSRYPTALFAALAMLQFPSGGPLPLAGPGLVRIRVVLTTEATAADLILETGAIVNTSVVSGGRPVRLQVQSNHLSFTHDGDGPVEARVGLLLSGLRVGARVRWHLMISSDAPAQIEVYNENEQGHPRLVDRFDASTRESSFESPATPLLTGGPVRISAGPRPLALAFFYPWAQHWNWSTDRLLDQPLSLYSTDLPDEVAQSLSDARAAGLDGLIVSWRGDTDWNDRR